jgi:hypothetical protein
MNRRTWSWTMAAAVLCALGAPGCFKSSTLQASFEGSSDSSSSPSKSSGGDEDEKKLAYERDVGDVTARHAAGGVDDPRALEKDVSAVAASYGVTDWEQDAHTYVGIGRGLAAAGVREPELTQFADALSHSDARYRDWIRSGYEGAAR